MHDTQESWESLPTPPGGPFYFPAATMVSGKWLISRTHNNQHPNISVESKTLYWEDGQEWLDGPRLNPYDILENHYVCALNPGQFIVIQVHFVHVRGGTQWCEHSN